MSPYFRVRLRVLFFSVLMSCPLLNFPIVQVRFPSASYSFLSDFKVVFQKSHYFWGCLQVSYFLECPNVVATPRLSNRSSTVPDRLLRLSFRFQGSGDRRIRTLVLVFVLGSLPAPFCWPMSASPQSHACC
ncbi:hypothetical protein JB92DRAFT_2956502 [Gautieria morchelliformis]|nr:hypothetical protein JB92DRAFT_2956502 [Gautieria morchelliformis]